MTEHSTTATTVIQKNRAAQTTMQNRFKKNLQAFHDYYPAIHQQIQAQQLSQAQQTATLRWQPTADTFDIDLAGRSLYVGDGFSYARKEADQFLETYRPGCAMSGISPCFEGDYHHPRLFNRRADRFIAQKGIKADQWRGSYKMPPFFSLLIFLGCAAGVHIERVLTSRRTKHVLISEPNISLFIQSLYLVEWAQLFKQRASEQLAPIDFMLGATEHNEYATLWYYLTKHAPIYPNLTVLYNHRSQTRYSDMCRQIDRQLYVYMCGWGHYDDEVNQWNNAFHNIVLDSTWVAPPKNQLKGKAVAIVGGGPSLDRYSSKLIALQDQVLIASCGSSIKSLYEKGICPDIHFELESDAISTDMLEMVDNPDYLKKILLIAPLQFNPLARKLFSKSALFRKTETGLAYLPNAGSIDLTATNIEECAPTCVNLATAFSLKYGASAIYLFGTDFGFFKSDQSHAEGSIYYEESAHPVLKAAIRFDERFDLFEIDSVGGDPITTQPLYYSAKERVENAILIYRKSNPHCKVINVSDGACIAETIHHASDPDTLNPSTLGVKTDRRPKEEWLQTLIQPKQISPSSEETIALWQTVSQSALESQIDRFLKVLDKNLEGLRSLETPKGDTPTDHLYDQFEERCIHLSQWITTETRTNPMPMYLIKGSLLHFLYIGQTHLLAHISHSSTDRPFSANDAKDFIDRWGRAIRDWLQEVSGEQGHFRSITGKTFEIDNDPLLKKLITDPE